MSELINLKNASKEWSKSAVSSECTLHQLSPYIGKMKSSMAKSLIENFTEKGETIYDPFVGCGTIALESWLLERDIIANDLSPYAYLLTMGKLNPITSKELIKETIDKIETDLDYTTVEAKIADTPAWVSGFFNSDTLIEILAWRDALVSKQEWFLLSCLMGILHHQRPGFLSYPSSHTVPYLRSKKFPKENFPELYTYRELRPRLEKKALRAIRRISIPKNLIFKRCHQDNSETLVPAKKVNAIISSPPYMRRLDYGRDNRLRLWFLGEYDWRTLDKIISPSEDQFLHTMRNCFKRWFDILERKGKCILVFDSSISRKYKRPIVDIIVDIACNELGMYEHIGNLEDEVPNKRRVRRNYSGTKSEVIIVLSRKDTFIS